MVKHRAFTIWIQRVMENLYIRVLYQWNEVRTFTLVEKIPLS
jgi:hypothetical protein